MVKLSVMTIVTISVLLLAYSPGHAGGMANPKLSEQMPYEQTSEKSMPTEHTQRDLDCAKARADQRCVGAADQCFYKFTVDEVVDQQNLKVTYPPSVWKETMESMRNTPEETAYRTKLEKLQFEIPLNAMNAAEVGKTYTFTRCPENEFTLGSEIDPNQIGMPSAPNQSKR